MKQHIELMDRILSKGRRKVDRTGVGTISIFGPQIEFDMDDGYPLPTGRKVFVRGIHEELMWFLNGETDNTLLTDKDVHIWDAWALKEDVVISEDIPYGDRIAMYANAKNLSYQAADLHLRNMHDQESRMQELDDAGVAKLREKLRLKKGACGPIYGAMWRRWPNPDGTTTDQIAELLRFLGSDNPKQRYSRRMVISGWNPSWLPDESKSHEENIIAGKQVLPPCHTVFQFIVEPLTQEERIALMEKKQGKELLAIFAAHEVQQGNDEVIETLLTKFNVPKDMLSLKLYARSQDVPIGTVFNIASYSSFLLLLSKHFNMKPGRYIHSMGDAHIYTNQVEGVKEWLTREDRPLPKMTIGGDHASIFDYQAADFELSGYNPHPAIKFEIAI